MTKTIEVSDRLYERLKALDCCGHGLDCIIGAALTCSQFLKEGRLRPIKTQKARESKAVWVRGHTAKEAIQ